MLFNGAFDDLSSSRAPTSEQPSEGETKEEKKDYSIRGRTDIDPDEEICCHCNEHKLEGRKYQLKSVKKDALYCANCGYLCIMCSAYLPDPPRRPQTDILICPTGHIL